MPATKPDTRYATLDEIRDMDRRGETDARPDAPTFAVPADFWQRARPATPRRKCSVHLRLDPDVLDWFKAQGKGYQTRMNAVLRSYMNANLDDPGQ